LLVNPPKFIDRVTMEPRRLVMIGDLVASRRLDPAGRRAVQERLGRLAGEGLGFRASGGDEFEWVLPDAPGSWDRVLLLRARMACSREGTPGVKIRCAVARGEVWVDAADPYAQDGPVFHFARAGLAALPRRSESSRRRSHEPFSPGRRGARLTAFEDGAPDPVRDGLLAFMDAVMSGWTEPQWEAIAGALEGRTYEAIGEGLGVTAQAVANRLRAAQLDLYLVGHGAIRAGWPGAAGGDEEAP